MPEAPPDPELARPDVGASFEEVRPAWLALADRAPNPFTSYEWASIWWRHFGRTRPYLLTLGSTASTRVILPMYVGRYGPLPALRFIGGGAGDQLGPVCAPEDRAAAAAALRGLARESGGDWRVVLAERLPGEWGWERELGWSVVRRDANPVIDLRGGWDAVQAHFGRHLRKEIGRKERVLERGHRVEIRRTADPDRLDADFDTFLALHRARWGDRSSLLPRARFHRAFAAAALDRGWLQLWILEVDGQAVAARYDFGMGDRWFAYSAGRDPAWSRASVGLIMRAHTIRAAIDLGASEYRLLRGDEAYKERFATSDPGLVTIVGGRGGTGRLAALGGTAASAARGMRRRLASARER